MLKAFLLLFLHILVKIALCQKPENIVFVHVGKAGGTSARKNYFKTFHENSLSTSYVYFHKPDAQNVETFIVIIRNPINRMIS